MAVIAELMKKKSIKMIKLYKVHCTNYKSVQQVTVHTQEQMLRNDTRRFLFIQNHNDVHRNFITIIHLKNFL